MNHKLRRKKSKYQSILKNDLHIESGDNPTKNIMLCNYGLVNGFGRSHVTQLFSQYGLVENITMLPFKSYCFVSYSNVQEAKNAFDKINGNTSDVQNQRPLYLIYTDSVPKTTVLLPNFPPGLEIIDHFITDEQEAVLLEFFNENWTDSSSMKNRQVIHYGYEFDYDNNGVKFNSYCDPIPKEFEFIINAIKLRLNWYPNQITINRYLPGQGIPSHIDTCGIFDGYIISLSLGSNIVMDYKNDNDLCSVLLKSKSLLIMSGESRNDWKHGITPRKFDVVNTIDGPDIVYRKTRISITFRRVVLYEDTIKDKQNLYHILGCDPMSSYETLKKSYRKLLLQLHPDKCDSQSAAKMCADLNKAWNVLKDSKLKKSYDEQLEQNNMDSQVTLFESLHVRDLEKNEANDTLYYNCRCGGIFSLPESEVVNESFLKPLLIPCDDCSLFVEINFP
ncbi:alkylated DNA repair protein alkB homolog 8-like [Adelges cooleyi]|uniref:alkylated DNA repair protein alkB homolog 8-like n=1 Tax=Adelges cooleyi TaxID=133065 RepID=UPI00217FD29F|nr:alkylated DNA repair protein alkB homolog 8-like [Adelges cooleyi]